MTTAKQGDTVRIHYTGTLDDGKTFDSSEGNEPLEFKLGARQVIAGFENAVEGMAPGEEKTVSIEPAEAYGERDENLVQTVERDRFPADAQIDIGTQFQASTQNGPVVVTVVEMNDDDVTIDANHMLAGQRLTFALRLVEVV
ncbi:MAG: peptidylprolyl isomerase [Proteobacteria bacterium]|nr:peptidylprolyl isomerase [Pseudomonadota bacterium]